MTKDEARRWAHDASRLFQRLGQARISAAEAALSSVDLQLEHERNVEVRKNLLHARAEILAIHINLLRE